MTIPTINLFSQPSPLQVFRNLKGSSVEACSHRALVIAAQYDGQSWVQVPQDGYTRSSDYSMKLEGCHIDAEDIITLLRESGDYRDRNIQVLADIPGLPESQQPTKQNIVRAFAIIPDLKPH
ncbi:hypothetical protein FRC12_006502 [Ceratobasidium sp. 428]|nr:hypothetical protein FRC12_006502 [Ceratobasidium sp. 428]